MPFALKLRRNPAAPRPSLRERYAALKGSAAKVMGRRPVSVSPEAASDPFLTALAAIRSAAAAYEAVSDEIEKSGMTPERQARERVLSDAEGVVGRAIWKTVPTTPAGHRALLDYARNEIRERTTDEGDIEDAEELCGMVLNAFAVLVKARPGAGAPLPAAEADPILAAIEAHRAAYAAWAPLLEAWNNVIMGTPEYDAAEAAAEGPRERERVAFNALLRIRPATAAGMSALAIYLPEAMRQSSPDTDPDALAALDALRDSALALGRIEAAPSPAIVDPIFALIDEHRALYRAHDAAYQRCGHLPDKNPAWKAERAARDAMWEHWRGVVLKTVPQTAEGCRSLAAYGLEYLNEQGVDIDVEGPMILDLIARSPLATAAQVECVGFNPARLSGMQVDLSTLSFLELALMHEAYQAARHVWEGVQSRPFSIKSRDPQGFVFPTAAGDLADFEEDRAGRIVDRIVDEMASRTPGNEKERDLSLTLRLRHELDCEDRIRRDDLMHEITQAWSA